LHALWAIGYDVYLSNPETEQTRRALAALDLLVVQDMFLTETARELAHVFLPAAGSFEKDGTFMNSERRIQRVRRAIDPPEGARPDWEILCDTARALARPGFDFGSAEEIWEEIRSVWPAGRGIRYERLERGGIQWPCPDEDHPGTEVLHGTEFAHGPRAKLQCVTPLPSQEVPSADYPFLLVTGRDLYQFNAGTMTMRTPHALLRPEDVLELCPDDAERLGLSDGDRVRIESRHGEVELPIAIRQRMRAGQVFATFHTAAAFVNRLTGTALDPRSHTPEYKRTAVRLSRTGLAERTRQS
ncbi:MAG: molybdopterin-dependent oxidoreductase, partial [Polyangiaceae bacterium]|nr:molybdopterin-dependent oxidoreductase [Polyangiaceae bacterium]